MLPGGEFSVIAACSSNMFYQGREIDKILLLIRSKAAGAALWSITMSHRQYFGETIWSQYYSCHTSADLQWRDMKQKYSLIFKQTVWSPDCQVRTVVQKELKWWMNGMGYLPQRNWLSAGHGFSLLMEMVSTVFVWQAHYAQDFSSFLHAIRFCFPRSKLTIHRWHQ